MPIAERALFALGRRAARLGLRRAGRVAHIAMFLVASAPDMAIGQAEPGYRIEAIEAYVKAGLPPERIWGRYVSKRGLAFNVDAAAERRLRQAGAEDAMISMLKRASVTTPAPAPTDTSNNRFPSQPAPSPPPAQTGRLSADELRPIYFGNKGRITPYVEVARLHETGGQVQGQTINTSSGPIVLTSTALAPSALMYGIVVDYLSVGLDIEAYFHQNDILMLNLGVKFAPFLPLGTSKVRLLASIEPYVGITRQTLAHLPAAQSDTSSNAIDVLNHVAGGDASLGLAYHWSSGHWVFAELHYRVTGTFSRAFRVPGDPDITDGIPWSKWRAHGLVVRFGVGF